MSIRIVVTLEDGSEIGDILALLENKPGDIGYVIQPTPVLRDGAYAIVIKEDIGYPYIRIGMVLRVIVYYKDRHDMLVSPIHDNRTMWVREDLVEPIHDPV